MPVTAFCLLTGLRAAANLCHSQNYPGDRQHRSGAGVLPQYLGNVSSLRDWGHAKDYVRMRWMMLQQDKPEDFVIATGVQYSVRQFVEMAAAQRD